MYFCKVKHLFNILTLLLFLTVALPPEAAASCCSSDEKSCHVDADSEKDHPDSPCGSSSCDCICCASISLVLFDKVLPEVVVDTDFHELVFPNKSLHGANFHSKIWQPPKF